MPTNIPDAVGHRIYGAGVETVLEHLLRVDIAETDARGYLAAGQIRVNGVAVTDGDTEMPETGASGSGRPEVNIHLPG